jgi:hypothetical protein
MANTRAKAAPWLKVEAADGVSFTFADRDEANKYLQAEVEKWRWLGSLSPVRSNGNLASIRNFWDPLARLAQDQSSNSNNPEQQEAILKDRLLAYLRVKPAIHERSALQSLIVDIAQSNPSQALWSLAWTMFFAGSMPNLDTHIPTSNDDRGFFAGLANAFAWRQTETTALLKSQSAIARRAAQEAFTFRDDAQKVVNDAKEGEAEIQGIVEKGRADTDSAEARFQQMSVDLQARMNTLLEETLENFKGEWHGLTHTYEEKLRLSAPASYWRDKQRQHTRLAKHFGVWSGIAAAIGAVVLAILFVFLFGVTKLNETPTWGHVLPSVVVTVMVLWVLRTLMRLTMSHVHLALDSEERRVMIGSYLALTKHGETGDDERKALFAAIFRSTGDGIVKDEAPPVPLWEMLKGGK